MSRPKKTCKLVECQRCGEKYVVTDREIELMNSIQFIPPIDKIRCARCDHFLDPLNNIIIQETYHK